MSNFISLILGVLFSVGLSVSGMINPAKVIGFLDIFRDWDYRLILVMAAAVGVNLLLFPLILKGRPKLVKNFNLSLKKNIDSHLILGAILFGVGWGIAGICPGPGIVNLSRFEGQSITFILSMSVGMYLCSFVKSK